ncbi:restriction endonuclease subunit S [Brevibacterium luteolum]|uniref:restriction endonuclease subunit S n=1 Tax=Brevibacterium luteolum TaxID=199591 RepID=UPI003EED317A
MSRIEELIRELCPRGVEFQQLGEVARIKAGPNINKRLIADRPGPYPVINSGREPLGHVDHFNVEDDPIGIASRGSVGLVTWTKGRFFRGNLNYSCTVGDPSLLDSRFLYYYLLRSDPEIQALATHQGIPALNAGALKTLRVPIPPLELQREIVRVLDKFTQLEAELEAELEARRAQYDYYAGELLTIDEDVRRARIGDVATIVRGASPRPIQKFIISDPEGVPWIKIGDVPADGKYITRTAQRVTLEGAAKSRRVFPGDFVLSNSMSFGRPYVSQIEGCIHDGWLAISAFEDAFERDYLYYLLRSAPVQDEFARRAGAGTVKNLNADIVRSVVIPVPPRADQKRVVELLDRFDALVNDISIGLPAELTARRKQYEYYRDRLLTFKEAV